MGHELWVPTECRALNYCRSAPNLGAFNLYDIDGNGEVSREEMLAIVDAIYRMVVGALWVRVCPVGGPSSTLHPFHAHREAWSSCQQMRIPPRSGSTRSSRPWTRSVRFGAGAVWTPARGLAVWRRNGGVLTGDWLPLQNHDGKLSKEEFRVGAMKDPSIVQALSLYNGLV